MGVVGLGSWRGQAVQRIRPRDFRDQRFEKTNETQRGGQSNVLVRCLRETRS